MGLFLLLLFLFLCIFCIDSVTLKLHAGEITGRTTAHIISSNYFISSSYYLHFCKVIYSCVHPYSYESNTEKETLKVARQRKTDGEGKHQL